MRKFLVNGKTLEFKDDTLATQCAFDSCDCVVIYDKDSKILAVANKCNLHKSIKDSMMLSEIKKHRDEKGLSNNDNDSETQKQQRIDKRRKEKKRIQKL